MPKFYIHQNLFIFIKKVSKHLYDNTVNTIGKLKEN